MDPIASRHDTTHEAIVLARLRKQPPVTSIITGVNGVDQLNANRRAADVTLSSEEMKTLGDAAPLSMEYPGWMLANSNATRAALLATGTMPASH